MLLLRPSLVAALLLAIATTARGQGGPPMVTDDPGTPGDGHWEINLGAIGSRNAQSWLVALPDLDLNYGWGDRLQLKVDTPWNLLTNDSGSHREVASGLGTTEFGVKWRFFDDEASGWEISTYPQLGANLHSQSVGRGAATAGRSLFLPIEAAGRMGTTGVDLEAGGLLEQPAGSPPGKDAWIGGVILAHEFGAGGEGMVEARRQAGGSAPSTLLNLGGRLALSPRYSLMGALGREFGAPGAGRMDVLAYLGVQIRL